ncbi:hypothetical protein A3F52_05020 [Candidatus Uhrbacteria bacterium RIFCSPHIGHO2_12_FULL_47_11]|nr:MAG: hypothetical protein A2753_04920 [Candidatus Uhrbacteria bacterium RIFCSPHIGHO2_01_FULL_47_11]OGL76503.1 MAG: hypothetical protein A3F52_05020 [Candidatus Uhrbacteria bacterium RIFCSPHIGHO2_12_FULL_47_11]
MGYIFQPFQSIGEIVFNMTRKQVRQTLKGKVKEFLKTPQSKRMTDAFGDLGFHVYYDDQEQCEAVELFNPAQVSFEGKQLIGTPYQEVKEHFIKKDEHLEEDGAGFISKKLGFGVYAPFAGKEPQEPIESVLVFRKEYHDIK